MDAGCQLLGMKEWEPSVPLRTPGQPRASPPQGQGCAGVGLTAAVRRAQERAWAGALLPGPVPCECGGPW